MATFQSEYEDTTKTIDDIVSSQLSSVLNWINIPGGLTKVSSSAAGFAWGYNGNNVWSCHLPCSGNWQSSDLSSFSIGSIHDIVTDNTTVYILYTNTSGITKILTTDANRQGNWATVDVPLNAINIFSTHTYIWAQDANNRKQMCPKPCVMSNWIPSNEDKVMITSSTEMYLYGKDATGTALQTDEVMRSGWYPISGFSKMKVESVIGSADTIYAIDNSSNPIVYDGKSVKPLDTSGYSPTNITVGNNEIWMTSATPGTLGNVFHKIETPDYASIINSVAPLDRKRDSVLENIETKFNQQTDVMTVNKQTTDVVEFFKKIFNMDGTSAKKAKSQYGHINEQIRSVQNKLDEIKAVEPVMQIAILTLLAISGIYVLLGGFIGWGSHVLAAGALGTGLFFILKSK